MNSKPRIAILAISPDGQAIALQIASQLPDVKLYTTHSEESSKAFSLLPSLTEGAKILFAESDVLLFVSAMGICVRTIAPLLRDKHHDTSAGLTSGPSASRTY